MEKPAAARGTFQANLQIEQFAGLLATRMDLPRRCSAAGIPNASQAQLAKYFVYRRLRHAESVHRKMAERSE